MMGEPLSRRERVSYSLGSLGNNLVYGLMVTYLLVFYTDVWALPAAAVGTLFVVARTWDAVSDPVIGFIVDNTRTRWGRFRPYLLFGPFVMGTIVVLVFASPNLSPTGRLAWAFATYIAWGMAFAFMDIPFWSLSAALTQVPRERSTLIMLARTVATGGIIAISVAALPLVDALGGGDKQRGWLLTAVVVAAVAVVSTLVCFAGVREREWASARERTTPHDVIELFRTNRPLRLLIASMLLSDTLLALKAAFTYYYLRYNHDAEALIPVVLGSYALATVGGALASPVLGRRFGRRQVAIAGSLVTATASLALFVTGFAGLGLLLAFGLIGGLADGASDIARMSMLADTVEYGQWRTGKRQEGMVFATNIFKTKIASAIAGGTAAFGLAAIGYRANSDQSAQTLQGLHIVFTLVPAALAALAVWPMLRYDLTESHYEEILDELNGTRADPR